MIGYEERAKIKAYLFKIRTDHFHQLKSFPNNLGSPRYEFTVGESIYFLGIKGNKALNEISDLLLKDPSIASNFSRKTIVSELQPLIAKIVNSQPKGIDKFCKESLDSFIQQLEGYKSTEWEIITPITNLVLTRDFLQVGRVTFRRNAEKILDMFKKITQSTESTEEVKKYISDELISRYNDKVLAFVTIMAKDKNNALEEGQREIDKALNVLRFYGRGTQTNDSLSYRMFIAREGYIFHGISISMYSDRAENKSTTAFNMNFTHTGIQYEYIVDDQVLDRMNSLSYDILNEMLVRDDNQRTDFEKKILDAIEFFGVGMHKSDSRFSYINFIISLELLLTNTWEPQKGLIAERVAMLLTSDVDERKDLFSEIERLYKFRSDLVHQGDDKITDTDISIISYIVFQVIVTLIPLTKKMQTFGTLVERFNTIKFSHPFE
jgi:hypothetical protein